MRFVKNAVLIYQTVQIGQAILTISMILMILTSIKSKNIKKIKEGEKMCQEDDVEYCPECGEILEDSDYCYYCGWPNNQGWVGENC